MGDIMSNLVGKKFGKLTVIAPNGSLYGRLAWRCLCDCGKEKTIVGASLRSGDTKSCGCIRGLLNGEAAAKSVILGYKRNAKTRGLSWELPDQRFFELTQMPCYYCSSMPSMIRKGRGNGSFTYNGVDRKENQYGYIPGNVVPCCKICQRAKMDMPFNEFVTWLMKVGTVFSDPNNFKVEQRKKKWMACSR